MTKDLLELLKFLDKKFGSITIETDRNYLEEGDFVLLILFSGDASFELKDLMKIREFCDDLTVNTDDEGKLFLQLLFSPKKRGERK